MSGASSLLGRPPWSNLGCHIHCLAHRLQLTLVATSEEAIPICQLFSYLTGIINLVASSSKRHDQLRDIEASHIAKLIDNGDLATGKVKNQGSHLASLNSLMRMFDFVCVVLQDIIKSKNLTQRSEGDEIYDAVTSIDFVFILHFLIKVLGIIDDLCLKFKEHGWDPLFKKVKLFCKDHEIEVSNLSALYKVGQGYSRIQKDNLTIKHHYRFDIFITSIGSLLIEMNSHFNDEIMKLFVLSYVLDPSDNYKAFWVEDIYKLMNDFYLDNFTKQEKLHMKIQLEHFQLDAHQSTELQKASTVAELCQVLAKTTYSAMKIVKTRLRNKMEDNILSTYLVAYIKKEIAQEFLTDSIIDKFDLMKKRMVQFRMPSIENWTKVKFF
ncbi:hypothetical protein V6Z11_A09G066300 [Gossypium hirsutum]